MYLVQDWTVHGREPCEIFKKRAVAPRAVIHAREVAFEFIRFVDAALCETALSRVPRRHQLTDEKVVPAYCLRDSASIQK